MPRPERNPGLMTQHIEELTEEYPVLPFPGEYSSLLIHYNDAKGEPFFQLSLHYLPVFPDNQGQPVELHGLG